jgi:hypothetical protein
MSEQKLIEFFNPAIRVAKDSRPVLFIDTFMWQDMATKEPPEWILLQQNCLDRAVTVVLTNVVSGELAQRNLKDRVMRCCGDALVEIPTGRITANQIVRALVCYMHRKDEVVLDWESAIWEVPILQPPKEADLKKICSVLTRKLNKTREQMSGRANDMRKEFVAGLVAVARDIWNKQLRSYGQILNNELAAHQAGHQDRRTYDRFFFTDYFTDLPAIMLESYLFAYLLAERAIKIQDVVDIFSISELIPYASVYTMDKDQHNRIKSIQKDYPMLFVRLDDMCFLASSLKNSNQTPIEAIGALLSKKKGKDIGE